MRANMLDSPVLLSLARWQPCLKESSAGRQTTTQALQYERLLAYVLAPRGSGVSIDCVVRRASSSRAELQATSVVMP